MGMIFDNLAFRAMDILVRKNREVYFEIFDNMVNYCLGYEWQWDTLNWMTKPVNYCLAID